ncbi:histidine kinase [Streptomyces sp. NPDC005435]|uniref:sensor histidine kinase n=1 Tax=Streptomyces sp. NPDC005435 TaxID=3154464 RepID=UPI003453B216
MRGPVGWWRGKSTPAKVEAYTRWSFHCFAVLEVASVGLPALSHLPGRPGVWLVLLVCLHAAVCAVTASRSLDWTRGLRPQPVRLLWALAAVTAAVATAGLAIAQRGPQGEGMPAVTGTLFAGSLSFGGGTIALGVRDRRRVLAIVAGFAAGAGLYTFPLHIPGLTGLGTMLAVLIGGGFLAFTSLFSVWLLNAVYALDEARETRARLAVAEERLRFGRDLHDVLGRNLSVISLKSELAVQLARRGRAEAVEQMIEVQRIAQESQREVREVVRGYREADLAVELAGAQGVLTAAGIACEVRAEAPELPAQAQSALGWVVREAATNVLRHGDAQRCAVTVLVREGRAVLTVENDGVDDSGRAAGSGGGPGRAAGSGRGSGLAGLRERLAAVDGVLEAGPAGGNRFRLVAEVPLCRTVPAAKVRNMSEVAP